MADRRERQGASATYDDGSGQVTIGYTDRAAVAPPPAPLAALPAGLHRVKRFASSRAVVGGAAYGRRCTCCLFVFPKPAGCWRPPRALGPAGSDDLFDLAEGVPPGGELGEIGGVGRGVPQDVVAPVWQRFGILAGFGS